MKTFALIMSFVLTCAYAHIIDSYDRTVVDPQSSGDARYQAVGSLVRLSSISLNWCSATLISSRHILTASHCLMRTNSNKYDTRDSASVRWGVYKFRLRTNSRRFERSVRKVFWNRNHYGPYASVEYDQSIDWAILELDQGIEDVRPMSLVSVSQERSLAQYRFHFAGVGPGVTLWASPANRERLANVYAQERCEIFDFGSRRHQRTYGIHVCDVVRGDSGGPIFRCSGGHCYVHGVAVRQSHVDRDSVYFNSFFGVMSGVSAEEYPNFATLVSGRVVRLLDALSNETYNKNDFPEVLSANLPTE